MKVAHIISTVAPSPGDRGASSWLTLIIVTGFAVCQLLKVSKMTNQAAAVLGLQALEEWIVGLQDHVTGMCFDTNSSNVASVLALVLNFKEY